MNSDSRSSTPSRRKGKQPPDETLYSASQAAQRLGVPSSTFQNYVRAGKITKVVPPGKKEGFYPKEAVERFAEELERNPSKRRRSRSPVRQPKKELQYGDREAAVDWIRYEDEVKAYELDCELYGFENAVSPDITWTWWQKNPNACMILYNKQNRKDIWGLISIIPMEEEVIFKLLRDEMSEKDIRPEHVLTYESGKHYSCYVAAISMKPEHRHSFTMLMRSVMQFWCEHPDVYIDKLFAFALGSPGMRLIRKLYFWPRRDISPNAWELDLRATNPSPAIEEYQRAIEAARNGKSKKRKISSHSLAAMALPDERPAPVTLEQAIMTDIPSVMDISTAIYGSSGTPFERRAEWLEKNPEYLYVARQADGPVIGYVSVMPLETEKIRMILSEEIHPGDITGDELQAFIPGQPIDIYIASLAVKPGLAEDIATKAGFELVMRLMKLFVDLGRRGVVIQNVFARSRTPDGIRTLQRMGFNEITSTAPGPQRHFMVNVEQSKLHFIRQYKEALREAANKVS